MCKAVYCFLYYKNGFYAADYDEGLELIGGRVDKGESNKKALIRELREETLLKPKNILLIKKIKVTYSFDSNRCHHKNKKETHYFYKIKVNKKPYSGDIKIKKVSSDELINSIKYPSRKSFIKKILGELDEDS